MCRAIVSSSICLALGLSLLTGCDDPPAKTKPLAAKPADPVKKPDAAAKEKEKKDKEKADAEAQKPKLPDKFDFSKELASAERDKIATPTRPNDGGNSGRLGTGSSGTSRVPAMDKLAVEVRDALKVRNTLVVWVLDRTSGSQVRSDAMNGVSLFYRDADKPIGDNPPNTLYTAIVAYSDSADVVTKEPLSKESQVRAAVSDVVEGSGKANTFTAVKKAADEFLPFRDKLHCQMIMVLLSTKAGDDASRNIGAKGKDGKLEAPDYKNVDAAVSLLKKEEVPVFAIGASTPFSQAAAKGMGGSGITESHDWERIDMDYPSRQKDEDLNDTGFPSYGIGRLCYETGGQFFAQRPLVGSMTGNFDPGYFRKYAPDYMSEEKYQAMLDASPAKKALTRAAREGGHVEVMDATGTQMFYKKGSEADFNNAVTKSQQLSARIDGPVDRLLKFLLPGEADRKNLKEPRWQANFDLAMGRIYAAKARVEGLDDVMGTLKGKPFANANSSKWILKAAATTSSISSVDNMAKKAHMYLERVIKEHPNTPWAMSAERELKGENMGWALTEE